MSPTGDVRTSTSTRPPLRPMPPGMSVVGDVVASPGVRRLGRTVALGGGGLTLLGVTGVGVLFAEARLAKRWIVPRMSTPLPVDGRWDAAGLLVAEDGPVQPGPIGRRPFVVAVLGDSAAAGLGADDITSTPGGLLARGVAEHLGEEVELRTATRSGAVSAELAGQVDRLEAADVRPDLVLVIIGGNDVTNRVPVPVAAAQLAAAVQRLVAGGSRVVVGTVPDLSKVRAVQQPLRALGGRWSRQLAHAQAVAVLAVGGHPVDLRGLTAADFHAEPAVLFADDRFHPSTLGYRRTMAHVVPVALGLLEARPDARDSGPSPVTTG